MPKVKMQDDKFRQLFLDVRKKTKDFSEIPPELLSSNPHYIKVFRMLCGKSLTELGSLLNKTHATIAQYERGAIKSIPLRESEKIVKILCNELPHDVSFENAMANMNKFRELANGGYVQAFKRAEKAELTKQEKLVKNVLQKCGTEFEPHKTLSTNVGDFNFDFWLPRKNIVIECTEPTSKQKAESLAFRAIKIKEKHRCKTVVIVPSNVSRGVLRRLSDYDYVVFMQNLEKLENII